MASSSSDALGICTEVMESDANSLEVWTSDNLIEWIESNLSTQYQKCIAAIKEHDMDGKLLKECLIDKDAKSSLLQILFPNSSDAFLRLSFMRKIEKLNHSNSQRNSSNSNSSSNDNNCQNISPMTTDNDIGTTSVCQNCGISISSLLIANHQRHCSKQQQSELESSKEENGCKQSEMQIDDDKVKEADVIAHIEQNITVQCEYCLIEFDLSLIDEHSNYCGSRTELCKICGARDTLKKFKYNQHKCTVVMPVNNHSNGHMNANFIQQIAVRDDNGDNITFDHTQLDINDENNQIWIPKMEKFFYDLEKLFHDRFVVDYNKTSSHFSEYDKFGNNKKKMYQQKHNEKVSNIRSYNVSSNHLSNESRHKFEKVDMYKGKSKNELRKEYDLKFKSILSLLRKILENVVNEPLNKKYRILKCHKPKLKALIFSYSPCCNFLRLCGFEYVETESCYKLMNANNALLNVGIGVLKYVQDSFESKAKKQDFEQNKWEMNQAYIKNDKSIFFGSWSCKHCNYLNRRSSHCKKCKRKKKHSLIKEKKKRMNVELSVERWICGICGNRNALQCKQCDNCKNDKVVSTKQYEQYYQNEISPKMQKVQKEQQVIEDKDDLYLHHDEWM